MPLTFKPINADSGSALEFAPKVIESQFGDGYKQVTNIGINSTLKSYNPSWTGLKYAEATYIIDFLDARKGSEPFYYQPNQEGALRLFRCKKYTAKWKRGRWCDISAEFEPSAAV